MDGIVELSGNPANEDFVCRPESCQRLLEILGKLYVKMDQIDFKIKTAVNEADEHENECDCYHCCYSQDFWVVKLRFIYQKYQQKVNELLFLSCKHALKVQAHSHFSTGLQRFGSTIASHPLSEQRLRDLPPAHVVRWGMYDSCGYYHTI